MAAGFTREEILSATHAHLGSAGSASAFPAVCTDTRSLSPGCLFVALKGERFDAHQFVAEAESAGAAGAVVEVGRAPPTVSAAFSLFEVKDTLAALGALAKFHRARFSIPLGAVGGSNGKTTTKEMVGAILSTCGPALKTEGNFNNEVGVPLTLFRLSAEHRGAVVEMGMNRPGEMGRLGQMADPDAAVITVVQPEHLEGLGSLEGVAAAEGELFRALRPNAVAVVNLDDPLLRQQGAIHPTQLTFGRDPQAQIRLLGVTALGREGMAVRIGEAGRTLEVRLAFIGEHNAQNATAAFALARALGYPAEACAAGLEKARPYQRRLNVISGEGGVTVIDDCYNANPASMAAALKTLDELAPGGRAVAVLGDMLELGAGESEEHAALGELAAKRADLIAFFGPRSYHGYTAAKAGTTGHFTEVEPLMEWLRPKLSSGDVVLVKGSRGMRLERVVEALTGKRLEKGVH